jgi:superfamily I DNA and/or RNA helicase
MMPSKLFYFDKLRSVHPLLDNADDKWCSVLRKIEATSTIVNPGCVKQRSWPFHFRGVAGKDQSAAVESFWGTNSWSNPEEASEILGVVQTLVAEGISTQSIGIMAAFRGQVVLIRRILRDKGLGAVNVGIVEDYQAVEREVIILSLTRSNNTFLANDIKRRIGLFQQPKRMNVALTRAENLLVVVGDPKLMEKDQTWKQWLEFCFHNGLWYGKQGNETIVSALKC